MNTTKNKKYRHIALNFSSIDVGLQEKAYNADPLLIDGNKLRSLNLNYEKFYCWGYFDVLTVILFDSIEKIVDLQKLSLTNQTYDHRYYYGRIIYPRYFNLQNLAKEMPLVGVSFIKFKNAATSYLKEDGIRYFIRCILKDKIDLWKRELQINDKELLPIIILSYGWEDIILLIFSKSYENIKRLILKLRTLKFDDIQNCLSEKKLHYWKIYPKKKPKHLTVTTWTIFSIYLSYSKDIKNINQQRRYAFENLIKKVKKDRILVDSIKLQSRPGHLDWAIKKIAKYKSLKAPQPIIGRNDLSLKLKNSTFKSFLKIYYKMILPQLLIKKQSPILSAETSFILDIQKNLEENIPCNKLKIGKLNLLLLTRPKDKNFIKNFLIKSPLPIHTNLALANIFITSIYLKNNFYTKSVMCSLISLIEHLKEVECNTMLIPHGNELQEEITALLEGLALSFIDRFRGIYPIGETSTLPLITYKGSFQKFLVSLDYLCQIIFLKALELVNKNFKKRPLYQRVFSCYIGNAPSPCISITPYINVGLINIPLSAIFNIKSLHYLFHEVGHTFWWSIFRNQPNFIPQQLKRKGYFISELFEDILSDYFEFILCFRGDYDTYKNHFIQSLETNFKYNKGEIKRDPELNIRFLSVKWLFEKITNNRNNYGTYKKIFKKINSARKEYIHEFTLTIKFLPNLLSKNKLFYKLIKSLTEYKNNGDIEEDEFENIIEKFRTCINDGEIEYLFWLDTYKDALDFFKVEDEI